MKITPGILGIIGGGIIAILAMLTIIIITGHDPSQYIGTITTIIGLTGLGTFLTGKVEKVEKQTNGTLSKRDKDNEALHQENKALRETLAAKTGETYTSSTDTTIPDLGRQ